MVTRTIIGGKASSGSLGSRLLVAVVAVMALAIGGAAWAKRRPLSWEYTTSPYQLDGISASMNGPKSFLYGLTLGSGAEDELLWLTAYEAIVVDEAGQNRQSQEFMCHSSLFLDGGVKGYRQRLGTRQYGSKHLFTLAQGADRIEFPKGFALPFPRSQKFQLKSQAMNLNPEHVGKQVRHRIRAEFVENSSLWTKPTPLFMVQAAAGIGVDNPDGPPGSKKFQGHWMVPPGEHTNTSDVTEMFELPFDTRAYYVSSHLHALAQWQELRDKTTGQVVHRVEARTSPDGLTLEEVKPYCSTVGLPLYKDHQYELVTHYNNTRKEPFSAMSMWFMYCEDKEFDGLSGLVGEDEVSSRAAEMDDEYCAEREPEKR